MKRCYYINLRVAVALVIVAVVGSAISAQAETVAYWRFEGNNGTAVADGTLVPTTGTPIRDEIGGNHAVSTSGSGVTWQGDDAGELLGSQVPNPDPLDTGTNGTLNADGVNSRSLFFAALSGDDHLVVADDDALDFSDAFTLEGYFRNTRPTKIGNVLNKRTGVGYKVWVSATTGIVSFGVDNGPTWGWVGFDDKSVNDDAWHHFAAIRDASGGLHIWVDGVEDLTPAGNGTTTVSGDLSNSYNLQIGADTSGITERAWDGYLDEIRLSNVALTSDQFLNAVPEPSSLSLALIGLICLAVCRRMRSK